MEMRVGNCAAQLLKCNQTFVTGTETDSHFYLGLKQNGTLYLKSRLCWI